MAVMPSILIEGTGLKVSRFIFGTASLFNAGDAKTRQKLLEATVAGGFTHFDTAPLYGFGMAERDLGAVLRACPQITITTKVGLYAPGGHDSGSAAITIRKAAGRFLPKISAAVANFSVAAARHSLEGSMRRLNRPHVELLLIHEPDHDLVATDEWCRWLEDTVTTGKVGGFGVAGSAGQLKPHLESASPLLKVIQTEDSLDQTEADVTVSFGAAPHITYGYVSAARARNDTRPAADILRNALQRQVHGAIIVSTTRPERIEQYGNIANGVV